MADGVFGAAFKAGYLLACCNVVNLHNEETIAADVLAEGGITEADVRKMDLSDYDKAALRKMRANSSFDPLK